MPEISVIIPTKNRLELLKSTIKSIENQIYEDWETVIIDDHSDDNTLDWLHQLTNNDKRHRVYSNLSKDKGASASRNQGIQQSIGKYIVFLDSDDLLAPNCLKERICFMQENPDLDCGIFQMELFRSNVGDLDVLWNSFDDSDDLNRFLSRDNTWSITGPIWKKDAINRIGRFPIHLKRLQDWEFHVRALITGIKYEKINSIDCFYRFTPDVSNRISNQPENPESHSVAIDLLWTATHLMEDRSKFSNRRRQLVKAHIFHLCQQLCDLNETSPALSKWHVTYSKHIINITEFMIGWVCLRLMKTRLHKIASLRKYIFNSDPAQISIVTDKTSLHKYPKSQMKC